MFADQDGLTGEGRRAAVGEVVADQRAGAHHDQLSAPPISEVVCGALEPAQVLRQKILDGFLGQQRMIGRQAPIDAGVAAGINRNDPAQVAGTAQGDSSVGKIHVGVVEIELQLLCRQQDAHVPDAFGGERFGFARHAGWQIVSGKIGDIEVALPVERHPDVLKAGPWQDEPARLDARPVQIYAKVRVVFQLPESGVPVGVEAADLNSPQQAVGVLFSSNIPASQRVGEEQRRRGYIFGNGDENVAGAPELEGEEVIRLDVLAIGHLHRGMVWAKFG